MYHYTCLPTLSALEPGLGLATTELVSCPSRLCPLHRQCARTGTWVACGQQQSQGSTLQACGKCSHRLTTGEEPVSFFGSACFSLLTSSCRKGTSSLLACPHLLAFPVESLHGVGKHRTCPRSLGISCANWPGHLSAQSRSTHRKQGQGPLALAFLGP